MMRVWDAIGWRLVGPLHFSFNVKKQCPRPYHEIKWWMTYGYFHVWFQHILRGKMPPLPDLADPNFKLQEKFLKTVPVFLGYGAWKRAFFHSNTFVANLKANVGCKVKEYDCSHWVMYEKPAEVNSDMREWLAV